MKHENDMHSFINTKVQKVKYGSDANPLILRIECVAIIIITIIIKERSRFLYDVPNPIRCLAKCGVERICDVVIISCEDFFFGIIIISLLCFSSSNSLTLCLL